MCVKSVDFDKSGVLVGEFVNFDKCFLFEIEELDDEVVVGFELVEEFFYEFVCCKCIVCIGGIFVGEYGIENICFVFGKIGLMKFWLLFLSV